jgi:LysM repeat protein
MNDNPELQNKNDFSDSRTYSPKRRTIGSGSSKPLRIVLVVLIILIVAGSIFYYLNRQSTSGEADPLELKVAALEGKITEIQNQLAELQGKIGTLGPDPALLQRMDALSQKVEVLERRKQLTTESKAKPSSLPKRTVSTGKQYHTVRKGEALSGISKKYGISVEELRKLNNLSVNQPLRAGQKLQVSPRR